MYLVGMRISMPKMLKPLGASVAGPWAKYHPGLAAVAPNRYGISR